MKVHSCQVCGAVFAFSLFISDMPTHQEGAAQSEATVDHSPSVRFSAGCLLHRLVRVSISPAFLRNLVTLKSTQLMEAI